MSGDYWRRDQQRGGGADNEVDGDSLWPGKRARTQARGPDHDVDPGKSSPSQALRRKPGRDMFDQAIANATRQKERLALALAANSFEQSFAAATALRAAIKMATTEIANNRLGLDARATLTSVEMTAQTLLAQAPKISEQAYGERMSGRGNKPRPEWERAERDWLATRGAGSATGGVADSVHHALDSEHGSALTDASAWSQRVGGDVGSARIVTGSAASSAASDLGARAFTVGNRVFFGGGHDASTDGGDLLEHELHHVVQQQGASQPDSWHDLAVLDHDDSLEVAAREHRGGGRGDMAIARDTGPSKAPRASSTAPGPGPGPGANTEFTQHLANVTSRWKAIGLDLFTNIEKPVKVPTVAMFESIAYGFITVDQVDVLPVNGVLLGPNREDYARALQRAVSDIQRDQPHMLALQAAVTNIAAGGDIQFNATRMMADQAALSSNGKNTLAVAANTTTNQLAQYASGAAIQHGDMADPPADVLWVKHEGGGKARSRDCQALVKLLRTGAPVPEATAPTKTPPSADAVTKAGALMNTINDFAASAQKSKTHSLSALQLSNLTIALEAAGPEARELAWNNKTQVSTVIHMLDTSSAQAMLAGLDPVEALYHKCESLVSSDEPHPGDAWMLKANQASGMLNEEAREALNKQIKLKAGGNVYATIRTFLLAHTAADQQPMRTRLLQHTKLKNLYIDRLPANDSRIIYRLIVRGTEAPTPEDMVHEAAEAHDGVGVVRGLRALGSDPVKLAALEKDPVFRSLIEKQTQEVEVDGLKVRPYQLCMTMWGRKVGENLDPNAVARLETNPDENDTPLTIPERIQLNRELLDACVGELWAEISGANFKGDDYARGMAILAKKLGDPQVVRDTLVKYDHKAVSAPYLGFLRREHLMWSAEVEKRFLQKHNQDLRAWIFEHSGPVNKAGAMRVLGLEQGAGVGMFNGQIVTAGEAAKQGKMPLAQALRETVFGGVSLAEICSVQSRVLASAIDNENEPVVMVAYSTIQIPVDTSAKALLDLTGIKVRAIDLMRNAFAEHSGHFETRLAAKFSGDQLVRLKKVFGLTADVDKVEGAPPPSLEKQGEDLFAGPAKTLWDGIAAIQPGLGLAMLSAIAPSYQASLKLHLDSPAQPATSVDANGTPKGSTVAASAASGAGHDIEERPPRTFRGYYQLHYGVSPLLHLVAAVRALGKSAPSGEDAANVLQLTDPDRTTFLNKTRNTIAAEDEDLSIGPHNRALVRASFTLEIAKANASKIWEILHTDGKLQLIEAELYGPYNDEEQRLIRVAFRKLSGGFDLTFYIRQAMLARKRAIESSEPSTAMSGLEALGGSSGVNTYLRAEAAKQQAFSIGGEGTADGDLMFSTIRTRGDDAELDRALSVTTKGEVDARTRVRNAVQRDEDGQVLRIIDDLEPEERNQIVADGALMTALNKQLSKPNYERVFKVLTGQADLADRMLSRTIGNTWWKKHVSGKPDQEGMKEDVRTYVRHLKLQFDKDVRAEMVGKMNGAEPSDADRAAVEKEISRRVHEACANLASGPTEKQVMDDVLNEEDKAEVRSILLNDGEAKDFALVGGANSEQVLAEIKGMNDAERAAKLADPAYLQMLGQRLGKEKDYREALNALSRTGGGSGGLASLDAKSRSADQTMDAKRDPRETLRALAKLSPEELKALQDDPAMQTQVLAALGDDDKMRALALQMLQAPGFVVDPKTKDDAKAKAENQKKLFEFTRQQSIFRILVACRTSNKWSVVLEEAIEVYKAQLELLDDPGAPPKPDPKAEPAHDYRKDIWDKVHGAVATFAVDHDDHPGALTTQTKVTGSEAPLNGAAMVKIVRAAVMRERDPSADLVDSKIWTADEQREQMSGTQKAVPKELQAQFGIWTEDRYKEEDVLAAINAASDDQVAGVWTSVHGAPVGGGPTMEDTYKTFRTAFDLAKTNIGKKEAADDAMLVKPAPPPPQQASPDAAIAGAASDAQAPPPPLHWSGNIKQSYSDDPVIADAELKRRQFLEYTIKVSQPFEHMLRPYMGDNRKETAVTQGYEPQLSGTGNKRYDTLKEALLARIPRLSPEVIGRAIHISAEDMWILKESGREELATFNLRHEKNLRSRGENTSERSVASEEKQELDTSRIRYGREHAKAWTSDGKIDNAEKEKLEHLGDENDRARDAYKTALENTAMWASLIIGTLVTIVATILTGGLALGPVAAMAIGAATAALSATAKAWVNRSILDTEFDSKDATEMITKEVLTSVMTIGTTFFAQKLLSAVSGLSTVARQANAARQVLSTPPPIWRVFLNQASEQVTSSMMNSVVEAGLEATDPMHFIDGYREGEKEAKSAAYAKLAAAPKEAMQGAVTSLLSAAVGKVLRPKGGGGVHYEDAAMGKRRVNIGQNIKKIFGDPEQKVAGALVEWAMNQEGDIDWAKAPADLFAGTIRQYGQVATEMHSTTAATASRGERARASMKQVGHEMTPAESKAYMHMTAEAGGTDTFVSAKDYMQIRSQVAMTGLQVWEGQHPDIHLSEPQREAFVKHVRSAPDADGMAKLAHDDPTTIPEVIAAGKTKAAEPTTPATGHGEPAHAQDEPAAKKPAANENEKTAATSSTKHAAPSEMPGHGGAPGGSRTAADVFAGQQPRPGEAWTFKSNSEQVYVVRFLGVEANGMIRVQTHEGERHLDPSRLKSARAGVSNPGYHDIPPNEKVTVFAHNGDHRTGHIVGYDEQGNVRFFNTENQKLELLDHNVLDPRRTQRAVDEHVAAQQQPQAQAQIGGGHHEATPAIVHMGSDAQEHVALATKLGVMPKTSVQVGNATFKIGELFAISDGRVAVLIEVEVNGQKFLRVAYRSNSQGGFRVLPARNGKKLIFVPGYDKGTGEHTIMLPNQIEEHLAADLAKNKVRRDLPPDQAERAFEGAAPMNNSFEDYQAYTNNPDNIKNSVKTEEILGQAKTQLRTASGKIAAPNEVTVANPNQRPDFKTPVRTYKTTTSTAGEVTATVFRSHDGTLEYTVFQDAHKRAWFKGVEKVGGEINSHGVNSVAIDTKALTTPLWEYPSQLPEQFTGPTHPTQTKYADAWKYVRRMPEIQEFYNATGTAMPGENAGQQVQHDEQHAKPAQEEAPPPPRAQHAANTPAPTPKPAEGPAPGPAQPVSEHQRIFGTQQPKPGELWTVSSKSGKRYQGTFDGYDPATGNLILLAPNGTPQSFVPSRLDVARRGNSHPELHQYGPGDRITLVSVRGNPRTGTILEYDEHGNVFFMREDGKIEKLRPSELDHSRTAAHAPGAVPDDALVTKPAAADADESKLPVDERATKPQQAAADPTEAHANGTHPQVPEHAGPRKIVEDHPDIVKMTSMPPEALMGAHQQSLVEPALRRMSDADYGKFKAIEATLTDPVARAFLYKAVAANNPIENIAWLAHEMAGKDSNWLIDNLTLGDPRGVGGGLKQQWARSCNAAMTLTLRGNADPVFALGLRRNNASFGNVDESNAHALNPDQAERERSMLESAYGGQHPNSPQGYQGQGAARSTEGGRGRFADDLLNQLQSVTGLSYQSEPHPSVERIVNVFESSLRKDQAVPFVVGNPQSPQAHYLLAQKRRITNGVVEYSIHDPWTGTAEWVTMKDLAKGNLPWGWKSIGTIEVPGALAVAASPEGAGPKPSEPVAPTKPTSTGPEPAVAASRPTVKMNAVSADATEAAATTKPQSPPSVSEQAPKLADTALMAVTGKMPGPVVAEEISSALDQLSTTSSSDTHDKTSAPTAAPKHVEVTAPVQAAVAEQVHAQALVAEIAIIQAVQEGKVPQGHQQDPKRQAFTEAWKNKHVDIEEFLKQFDMEAEDAVDKINRSKQNPEVAALLNRVPQEELIAIILYTSTHYVEWNRTLREGDHGSLGDVGSGLALADRGLSKLPTYEGWAIRGTDLSADQVAKYAVGATVTEDGFTSTSQHDAGVGKSYDKNVTFKIKSKTGRDVQALSRYDNEKEILFRPGTKFKVVEKERIGDKIVITMEEEGADHHAPGGGSGKKPSHSDEASRKKTTPVEEAKTSTAATPTVGTAAAAGDFHAHNTPDNHAKVSAKVPLALPEVAARIHDAKVLAADLVELPMGPARRKVRIVVEPFDKSETAVATFDRASLGGTGEIVVRVSDGASEHHVARALAHELAEINQLLSGKPSSGVDALGPGSKATVPSAHDAGRVAEIMRMAEEFEAAKKAKDGPTLKRLSAEAEQLAEAIGLRAHDTDDSKDNVEIERIKGIIKQVDPNAPEALKTILSNKAYASRVKPRVQPAAVRTDDNGAVGQHLKIAPKKLDAFDVARAKRKISPEEQERYDELYALAKRGEQLDKEQVRKLRELVDRATSDDAVVDDNVAFAQTASKPPTPAAPLRPDAVIVDSNMEIAARLTPAELDAVKPASREAELRRRQRMTELGDKAHMADLSHDEVTQKVKTPSGLGRFAMKVERDSDAYHAMIETLVRYDVGAAKGRQDRAIIADAFFAVTANNKPATFETDDHAIAYGLYLASGRDPGNDKWIETAKAGFAVKLHGQTLNVKLLD